MVDFCLCSPLSLSLSLFVSVCLSVLSPSSLILCSSSTALLSPTLSCPTRQHHLSSSSLEPIAIQYWISSLSLFRTFEGRDCHRLSLSLSVCLENAGEVSRSLCTLSFSSTISLPCCWPSCSSSCPSSSSSSDFALFLSWPLFSSLCSFDPCSYMHAY